MCTVTLGWKVLIMVAIVVYSLFMLKSGETIGDFAKEGDDKMVIYGFKLSIFIIAVVCIIVWFLLS